MSDSGVQRRVPKQASGLFCAAATEMEMEVLDGVTHGHTDDSQDTLLHVCELQSCYFYTARAPIIQIPMVLHPLTRRLHYRLKSSAVAQQPPDGQSIRV